MSWRWKPGNLQHRKIILGPALSYWQVYLHKTRRQRRKCLLIRILKRAKNFATGGDLFSTPSLKSS